MKSTRAILALAGLNVALLAVIAWQATLLRSRPSAPVSLDCSAPEAASGSSSSLREESGDQPDLLSTSRPLTQTRVGVAAAVTAPSTNRLQFDWRQVESEDYHTYIKRLREIGVPEQTVRDIVSADVLQAYAARRAEVMTDRFRDFKYWKADTDETTARAALETKRYEIDDAMGLALRELLGPDALPPQTAAEWRQAALNRQLDFLPDDKRQSTTSLLQQFADVDANIKELAWNHRTPESSEERERVMADYERKRAALHELLTPEEYENVDMTASWTAENLRQAMAKFHPTEDEFRIIFREWRKQDEMLAGIFARGGADPGNEQVFTAIEKQLSPERYALYRETWWK